MAYKNCTMTTHATNGFPHPAMVAKKMTRDAKLMEAG
jgi:hypothetical protein